MVKKIHYNDISRLEEDPLTQRYKNYTACRSTNLIHLRVSGRLDTSIIILYQIFFSTIIKENPKIRK